MRHVSALVLLGLFVAVFSLDPLLACGDKLLFAGRDYPYPRGYAAIHPGAIVIYLPRPAHKGAGSDVASLLRRAGHDADVITDAQNLTRGLLAGRIDVVLADIVNMPDVKTASVDCESHPALVPILDSKVPAVTFAAVMNNYPFALKGSASVREFLGTIDKAMTGRDSHASKKKH